MVSALLLLPLPTLSGTSVDDILQEKETDMSVLAERIRELSAGLTMIAKDMTFNQPALPLLSDRAYAVVVALKADEKEAGIYPTRDRAECAAIIRREMGRYDVDGMAYNALTDVARAMQFDSDALQSEEGEESVVKKSLTTDAEPESGEDGEELPERIRVNHVVIEFNVQDDSNPICQARRVFKRINDELQRYDNYGIRIVSIDTTRPEDVTFIPPLSGDDDECGGINVSVGFVIDRVNRSDSTAIIADGFVDRLRSIVDNQLQAWGAVITGHHS